MSSQKGNSHTNSEIGRSLERARAERGLSLWQVEEATKIRARYLHDLERENFDVLPAVYVLGSLKTYADFLGLNGEALARQLKSRQEPPPEERDPIPEEATQSERGGFLAALGGLPLIGDRDAVGDDQGAAPAAVLGYGSRLYLGLGAALILILAIIALTTILGGGDQPAVSQVREPVIPETPSRVAFSVNAEGSKDDERNQDAESKDDWPGEQADSPDGGDEKGKKVDEKVQVEKNDQDDTQPEDTGDVAVALPASITAASTASASPSAVASATSIPVATAPANSPPETTAPAVTAPSTTPSAGVAPGAASPTRAPTPPETEPAPTAVRWAPAATGAQPGSGSGRMQAGGLDGTRLTNGILNKVRSAADFAQ